MYLVDIYEGDGTQGTEGETYPTQAEAIREPKKAIRAATGKPRNKRIKGCGRGFGDDGEQQTAIIAWELGHDGFVAVFEIPEGME